MPNSVQLSAAYFNEPDKRTILQDFTSSFQSITNTMHTSVTQRYQHFHNWDEFKYIIYWAGFVKRLYLKKRETLCSQQYSIFLFIY